MRGIHDYSWEHSTECADCRKKRWEIHTAPEVTFGIGPSHPEYYKKEQHNKFNRDMDSYRSARRSGLQPESVSHKAVEKAEKRAYLEEKVMKRN